MSVTPTSFRQQFPEFKDPLLYSDAVINGYVTLAGAFLNAERWGTDVIDFGTSLFVAHYLVLSARDAMSTNAGGVPGAVTGVISSTAVDRFSAGYDTGAVTMENGAFWNMTRYGIDFLRIARMMGAGGMQLGIGPPGPGGNFWMGYGGYNGYGGSGWQ